MRHHTHGCLLCSHSLAKRVGHILALIFPMRTLGLTGSLVRVTEQGSSEASNWNSLMAEAVPFPPAAEMWADFAEPGEGGLVGEGQRDAGSEP